MLSLANAIRRQLLPALERSQGVEGSYTRGSQICRLIAVPTKPDWVSEAEQGAGLLLWRGLVLEVSVEAWQRTGLGTPAQGDTFTVFLADGSAQSYSLLPPKGKRPYEMDAEGTTYFLNAKLVAPQ